MASARAAYWKERAVPYRPGQKAPFKVSRSKIELFMQCPRCFWLDVRLKVVRPSSPPFNINSAIDGLFKKEFDAYRAKGKAHPLMTEHSVQAVPFAHEKMDDWRENFVGVQYVHPATNLMIFGAVDDLWINSDGELIVADYKATAKDREVNIDADWQMSYKRQMEIYQWLLRQNGFAVSDTGYFVYTNGRMDMDGFFGTLEFKTKLIPYTGDDSWVEKTILQMKQCMDSDEMPPVGDSLMGGPCEHCTYARQRTELTLKALQKQAKKSK